MDREGDRKSSDAGAQPGRSIAILAHELRGPLSAIRNASTVLQKSGDDPAKREWAIGVVDRQTQQLIQLVDELLTLSRLNYGKVQLNKQRVDLARLIHLAMETVRPCIEERRHWLEVTMPAAPITLEADASRLEQVVTNLLANAAKYSDPGGRIELMVAHEEHDIVLRVRDNGFGIAQEELQSIFEPFWQSSQAVDHARGGLGLGLALVQKLVEMHGGGVSASSDGLGRGSEFVVRLPKALEV
jgi:signal transduction histidine kinase